MFSGVYTCMSEANCSVRAARVLRFRTSLKQIIATKGWPDLNKSEMFQSELSRLNKSASIVSRNGFGR
jgi:hypothetical protein